MKSFIWKTLLIVALILFSIWAITPPRERLKLGKDLAGGTTLTYRVEDPETGEPPTAAEMQQLISVIKDRIDPSGIYDISVIAQGTNQIEITMPAPTPEVKQRRDAFEARLAQLDEAALPEGAVDEAVRLAGEERRLRLEQLAAGMPERLNLLEVATAAYDRMQESVATYYEHNEERERAIEPFQARIDEATEARAIALDAAVEFGLTEAEVNSLSLIQDEERINELIRRYEVSVARRRLQDQGVTPPENDEELSAPDVVEALQTFRERDQEVKAAREELNAVEQEWAERLAPYEDEAAEARLAFEAAREAVEATSLESEELRRVLRLEKVGMTVRNRRTGEFEELPSPREIALERLTSQYPTLAEEITELTALYDHYRAITKGYDDPKELIALLRGAGVLTFRIAVTSSDQMSFDPAELRENLRERGPRIEDPTLGVRWFPIDNVASWANDEQSLMAVQTDAASFFNGMGFIADVYDGVPYILLYTTPESSFVATGDEGKLRSASATVDDVGRPAVAFRLDAKGAQKFGAMTGENIGKPLAIVLDDRVFSAPTLQGRISDQGQITGRFSQADIDYLLKVLNAGALQAQLSDEPIAQNTLGPQLGADNLRRGLDAGVIALIVVGAFMIMYYFGAGIVADFALFCNALMILGAMSVIQAAFTMPGIAGIILTFGMAVDSNVLIYERIREELESGKDLKTSVRLGYDRALSSIIDGNVTNLIVCFVLGFTATAEVKGFAITFGIGVVSTLFTALFITRVIFDIYVNVIHAQRLPMLPSIWPLLNRLLYPTVSWIRYRHVWYAISTVVVIASIALTASKWREMLDTEFLGGTSAVFQLRSDESGEPLMLPRAEVEQRLEDYAVEAYEAGRLTEEQSRALRTVVVYNYNIDEVVGEDFRGNAFMVRSTLEDPEIIERAVSESLADVLTIRQPVHFDASDIQDPAAAPLRPVLSESLGEVIGDPEITNDVEAFMDGVAMMVENMSPPLSRQDIASRIERARASAEFQEYMDREVEVFGLTPAEGVNAAGQQLFEDVVILVHGEGFSFLDQRDRWMNELAAVEWRLLRSAMTEPESLDQVTTISASIAKQFRDQAVIAIFLSFLGIIGYIWIRFASLRYSMACVIPIFHDVCITLGLLSLTHVIYQTGFAKALLIEPFKIDLGVIAAILTIIGYSLNDTIVILDRVRENRGKLAYASAEVIDNSVNQSMSRTFLTAGTTLLAIIVMYILGSSSIRPFMFTMFVGVVLGTYSTICIGAPIVYKPSALKKNG